MINKVTALQVTANPLYQYLNFIDLANYIAQLHMEIDIQLSVFRISYFYLVSTLFSPCS